jgi:hypothetical protein
MGTKRVDVGLLSFGFLRKASAFLVTHQAIKDYSLFVCSISLMAVSSHGLDSLMDKLKFDDYSSKRGQDSTQAVFELSFRNKLPQLFGQLPQSGIARNSRALLALPSYSDWTNARRKGIMRENVEAEKKSLKRLSLSDVWRCVNRV